MQANARATTMLPWIIVLATVAIVCANGVESPSRETITLPAQGREGKCSVQLTHVGDQFIQSGMKCRDSAEKR